MTPTTYTRKELDHEARWAVNAFRRTLPSVFRRTVKYDGWILRVGDHTSLVAFFTDENGQHDIPIAI